MQSEPQTSTNGRIADLDDLPANEPVRLQVHVTGVLSQPEIVLGETSSTGKTISAHLETWDEDVRLDAETIFRGDAEFRDSLCIQLYTPSRFQQTERANHGPGAQAGATLSDCVDLPEPTHLPASLTEDA